MRRTGWRLGSGVGLGIGLWLSLIAGAGAEEITLYGAGSLRDALTDVTRQFSARTGVAVRTAFGPSGLMRERIEKGEAVDLFASADMAHPLKLREEGAAAQVVMFTRNRLCAFAKPEAGLTAANFAERLADPVVKLGTSTPGADPGGDYTWAMFHRIDGKLAGAFAILDGKAQKLVGGSTAPAETDPIADGFAQGRINVMMGYCSGAAQRRKVTPDLDVVPVPEAFGGGPEYGLAVIRTDRKAAVDLALAILSPEGQATLARYGFAPVGAGAKP